VSCFFLAAANLAWAQRSDPDYGGNDPDREMDPDEARDYTSDYYICPVARERAGAGPASFSASSAATVPTIPNSFKDDQSLGSASTDTQRDRGHGSRHYKVNIWMWRYGRGRPQMVSIAEAERIRRECISESRSDAARPLL
jgi:hypothetical protein